MGKYLFSLAHKYVVLIFVEVSQINLWNQLLCVFITLSQLSYLGRKTQGDKLSCQIHQNSIIGTMVLQFMFGAPYKCTMFCVRTLWLDNMMLMNVSIGPLLIKMGLKIVKGQVLKEPAGSNI